MHVYFVYRSFHNDAKKTSDYFSDKEIADNLWEKEIRKQLRSANGFEQYNISDWVDMANALQWGFGKDDAKNFKHIIKFEMPTENNKYT